MGNRNIRCYTSERFIDSYTMTRKSIVHFGLFKKTITFLVVINLKLELNIVHV